MLLIVFMSTNDFTPGTIVFLLVTDDINSKFNLPGY